jgi:hypothetical protein
MAASGTTKKSTINQLLGAGGTATLASATITGAATVGTTFGVTGASTFTGAATFNGAATLNGNTTLGDAQTDTSTINAQLTARQGEFPSAVRAAASDYAAVTFDGATSSQRIASTITTNPITTGDYTVWSRFRVPATTSSNQDPLWTLGSDALGAGAYGIIARYFTASNLLNILLRSSTGGASGGDSATADVTIPFANYAGQVVDLVVVRVGSVLTVYLNGTSLTVTYSGTQASFALAPGNFPTNPAQLFGVGASTTTPFRGRIFRSVVFNRALSAADVVEVGTTGVNPADQWGTQTAAYTSDFSVNEDSWSQNIGNALLTATGNIDGISGVNDTLRFTNTDTVVLAFQVARPTTTVANKRFRLVFDYFAETSSGLQFLGIGAGGSRSDTGSSAVVENVWQTGVALEFVRASSGLPISNFTTATGSVVANVFGVSKNVYFKNFVLTRIGAIVDLDFTVGTGYQATDRSTNNLHGTLFNGVEFTQPKRVAVVYATTATNGNQQMLGTLAIPTNAIIEDIIVNSTGSATVSVGNASAGTQIVNGASVVSGRQKLTLATPFSTTGNLWVNSNATATLQFTILYTIAS